MDYYAYNPVNGEFTGAVQKQPEAASGPSNSTDIAPPSAGQDQAAVWDGAKWNVVIDKRGQRYRDLFGVYHEITALGQDFPSDKITLTSDQSDLLSAASGLFFDPPLKPNGAGDYYGPEALDVSALTSAQWQELTDKVLSDAKERALELIKAEHAKTLKVLAGNYSTEERDTWPILVPAAKAYLSGSPSQEDAELIDGMAANRQITGTQFANIVTQYNQANRALVVAADQLKVQTTALVQSATTPGEIDEILNQAKAQAEAAAEQWQSA